MAEGQKDKMTKEKNGKRKKLQKGQKEKITKKAKEKKKKDKNSNKTFLFIFKLVGKYNK